MKTTRLHEESSDKRRDENELRSCKPEGGGGIVLRGWNGDGGRRGRRFNLQDFDYHPEASLAVAGDAADEVEQTGAVEREGGVAVVGEEHRVRRSALVVLFLRYHHHWILLVLEPCVCIKTVFIYNGII